MGNYMNVLVLNCGSSSLKFQILVVSKETIEQNNEDLLCKGLIERIGSQSLITIKVPGQKALKTALPLRDHKNAIQWLLNWVASDKNKIGSINSLTDIHAVGHRVVHGGEKFQKSVYIDEEVIEGIEECMILLPCIIQRTLMVS